MVEYQLKITDQKAVDMLDKLNGQRGYMERIILKRVAQGIISHTQTNYLSGQVLKRQSGNLANSLQYRMMSNHAVRIGPGMVYGAAHEFGIPLSAGLYIYPKRAKALRFESGGGVVFAKRVRQHVKKRPYLAPAIQDYFSSGKANTLAEKTLQEYIDRL